MEIINPFQAYSWKIRQFILLVSVVQLLLLLTIAMGLIGLQIPFIRHFTGIIYLLFIPGTVILRILKLEKLDNVESLLYTIGLSIAFLMFTGFFINQLYPVIGIQNPISILPLIATIYFIISVLTVVCYYKEKDYYSHTYISSEELFSPKPLLLFLIPLLAIYSTYFVNIYHNNNLTVTLIILVSLIILLNGFFNVIPERLYPLAIFSISLSLLFHNSLISSYLWGCDIQSEYYFSNMVATNSYWNPYIEENINSMLSIVMFAPIISSICDIDLLWVFKIIFPLLFSLLPMGIYKICSKQISTEIAFVSCLFFISGFMFYTEMLALARQQLSELFFILLILLMLNKSIEHSKKAFLSVVFAFSIAVSHYGFSYIFLLFLFLSFPIYKLIISIEAKSFGINSYKRSSLHKVHGTKIYSEKIIAVNFIVLITTFTLGWYIYTSRGLLFSVFVNIVYSISSQLFNEFLETQGVELITTNTISPMRNITKYLHLISIFFISMGMLRLLLRKNKMKFTNSYASFSFSYYMVCILGVAIPLFASQLNTSRLYQISLLILAPFFSIGGISFFNVFVHRNVKAFWMDISTKQAIKLLSIFLAVFFLFNSGLIYDINGEESSSVSINNTHYPFIYNQQDVSAADWIISNKNVVNSICADIGGTNLLRGLTLDFNPLLFSNETVYLPKDNYTLITTLNTRHNEIYVGNSWNQLEYIDIKYLTEYYKTNNIYDNGYGKVGFSIDII